MAADAPQSQKTVLAGLIAFGVLAIALGAVNLKRAIGPAHPAADAAEAPSLPTTREELEAQQREALAGVDTDRDGLSDLDELDRVHTSPFLADSDSDGKSDKEEVDAGTDPNCPEGKTCAEEPRAEAAPERTGASPIEAPGVSMPTMNAPSAPASGANTAISPPEIRTALIRQGLPQATVDRLTDEQLMASYSAAVKSFSELPGGGASPLAGPLTDAFTSALRSEKTDIGSVLEALPKTPSAIRDALLRSGFPREKLEQLNDAALLAAWEQVITDLKNRQQQSTHD